MSKSHATIELNLSIGSNVRGPSELSLPGLRDVILDTPGHCKAKRECAQLVNNCLRFGLNSFRYGSAFTLLGCVRIAARFTLCTKGVKYIAISD